jgi:hypothetical protein
MKIQKLTFVSLILMKSFLFANPIISSSNLEEDKKPVDEGQKKVHKEDRVKGSTTITDTFQSKTLLLSKEKNSVYKIILKKASHVPITCKLIRNNTEIEKLTVKQRNFSFNLETSLLKVDDNITIRNRYEIIGEIIVKE